MATIAFLGLGQMGSPMANNLLQKGHSLQVFDVNAQAVDALVTQGATAAQTPAEAAAGAEFIITMLPNGDIVRQVLLGEKGVCEAVSSDALLIDMSTIHPLQTDALIRELQDPRQALRLQQRLLLPGRHQSQDNDLPDIFRRHPAE